MTTTIDYSKIDPNRPASWNQMKAINTRLSQFLAKKFKLEISDLRPIIGKLVTNKDTFTHGVAQEYFKIEKVTQIDKDLVATVKKAIENPESIKAVPKKRTAKKTTSSVEEKLDRLLASQALLFETTAEIVDRVTLLEDSKLAE